MLGDRTVSNLELLYDLVYVAVIGQASHTLAQHLTARGIAEFAIVFGMVWIAWINGSLYVELHGRQDGRTRLFVFVQMAILALLAVFTGGATTDDGAAFAITYALFLAVVAWLWLSVRRRDRPEFLAITGAWLVLMAVSIVVVVASALLPSDPRLAVWAAYVIAWLVGMKLLGARSRMFEFGARPTDSMVERFGLFTIIVLGELVIGVVVGLSAAEQDALTIATGLIALAIGFGFWWMYFDIVGRPHAAAGRRGRGDVDHRPLPDHAGDRRFRRRNGVANRARRRSDGAARDGLAAVRGGRRWTGRADPHSDRARGRAAAAGRVPPRRVGHGGRGGRRARGRLAESRTVAARAPPRADSRDPLGGGAGRVPAGRRLGGGGRALTRRKPARTTPGRLTRRLYAVAMTHPTPYAAELEAERVGWYEMTELVRSLTPDECLVPGYYRDPDWTVRDAVAHLGTWLAEAAGQLERLIAGTYEGHDVDIDALNAVFLAAMQGQPWDVAWVQANAGRSRMLQVLAELREPSDEAAWWIRKAGRDHYGQHLPRLREWVAELIARRTT